MVKSLDAKLYKKWLRELGKFSLEKGGQRGNMTDYLHILEGLSGGGGSRLVFCSYFGRTRNNGFKLGERGLCLNIEKNFLTARAF